MRRASWLGLLIILAFAAGPAALAQGTGGGGGAPAPGSAAHDAGIDQERAGGSSELVNYFRGLARGFVELFQFGSARRRAQASASQSQLKQLGMALMNYITDWDDTLPPMQDPPRTKEALRPYMRNDAILAHPDTGHQYEANRTLSSYRLMSIPNPAETVFFYDPSPDTQGGRSILFVDGQVKWFKEEQFAALLKASQLPPEPVVKPDPPSGSRPGARPMPRRPPPRRGPPTRRR